MSVIPDEKSAQPAMRWFKTLGLGLDFSHSNCNRATLQRLHCRKSPRSRIGHPVGIISKQGADEALMDGVFTSSDLLATYLRSLRWYRMFATVSPRQFDLLECAENISNVGLAT